MRTGKRVPRNAYLETRTSKPRIGKLGAIKNKQRRTPWNIEY